MIYSSASLWQYDVTCMCFVMSLQEIRVGKKKIDSRNFIELQVTFRYCRNAGYFIMYSPLLKINRTTKAAKYFIDAAKQVKPEPMLIANAVYCYSFNPAFWQYYVTGCYFRSKYLSKA